MPRIFFFTAVTCLPLVRVTASWSITYILVLQGDPVVEKDWVIDITKTQWDDLDSHVQKAAKGIISRKVLQFAEEEPLWKSVTDPAPSKDDDIWEVSIFC